MDVTPRRERRASTASLAAAGVALLAVAGGLMAQAGRRRRRPTTQGAAPFVPPPGLTEAEAVTRLAARAGRDHGAQPVAVRTWEHVRRESIFTVFNLNLIGLSFVQLLLRDLWGATVSLMLLALTTGIRLLQEQLAARRIRRFLSGMTPQYTVLREGRARSVDPALVVPGDVLVLGPGDQLLADGTLIGPADLLVDESPVTGVRGWRRVRPGGTLYGGSFCVTGRGVYTAERLGADRVVSDRLASDAIPATLPTPLERLVGRILKGLLAVVVLYAALLLAAWFRLDLGAGELILDAAPVIFSLAPSGLYLMIIVTYATGTADLAQRGALVRSARSVESLAETTVLCFTEVGILAGTSMELAIVPHPEHDYFPESRLRQILGDAARSISATGPVLEALVESFDGERRPVREEAANLTTLGWSAIVFADEEVHGVYVIGERRVVEGNLTQPLPAEHGPDAETLVLAYRPDLVSLVDAEGATLLPKRLIALGTVQFRRHLRPEAMEVVRGFVRSGVRIKAFATNSPEELVDILREAGLASNDVDYVRSRGLVSRADLEQLPRSEWGRVINNHALFGGFTPLQVGEIVRSLRTQGEMVAVVGDGVRDLPALHEATLAVAQPASTQAALGLADIVLLDNSPGALLKVLGRGQAIVSGLLDVLRLNLTMVVCSALLIIDVRLITIGFPYVASQGALISILSVTIPSVVLSLSMSSRAKTVSRGTYARTLTRFILPAGVTLSVAALLVYLYFLRATGLVSEAQLAVTYTLLYSGLVVGFLTRRDRRQAILALSLGAVATLLPLIPWARRQFRLNFLPDPWDYGVVLLAVAGWVAVLLLIWRLLDMRRPIDGAVADLQQPVGAQEAPETSRQG